MNTKFGQKFMHVLIAMLFLFGTLLNGVTPVSAAPGVSAAATASNLAPTVGQTITVTVNIDMSSSGGQSLGSYTGDLDWNPSVLTYVSHVDASAFGFAGAVNIANVSTGTIAFNGANASGAMGNTNVLVVTFSVTGGGNANLDLGFSAMSTIVPTTNLLPVLSVNVSAVSVPAAVSLDGAVHSNTSNASTNILTISHTTGTGVNRLMLVGVSWNSGTSATTISSVNFAYGDPLTTLPLGSAVITQPVSGQNRYTAIYKLLNPPSGIAGTVTVTFSASFTTGAIAGVANFKGVDQTTPLGTATGTSTSNTTATVSTSVSTTGTELVFDTTFAGGASTFTISAGSSQSEQWNSAYIGNSKGGASIKAATASPATTTSMTWNRSNNGYMAIAAVPIIPAPVGPTQQLTMAATPSAGGTVTPALGAHTYPQDTYVDITAVAATGYSFSHWTPDTNGYPIDNPYEPSTRIIMDADYTVTAHFAPDTHYLTTNVVGSGSITKNPDIVGPYTYGTEVELTAVPASGWVFTGWSGDLTGLTNPQTVTMTANRSVTATFIQMLPGVVYPDGPVVTGTMETGSIKSLDVTTGSGQNRLMLVGVSYNSSTTGSAGSRPYISSVIFTPTAGSPVPLDLVRQQWAPPTDVTDPGRMAAIYILNPANNPAAGTVGVLSVTFSASFTTGAVVGVANFQGVNQTTPLGTPNSAATTNSVATVSVDVTTTGNELVFDTVFAGGQSAPTISENSSQTALWNVKTSGTSGAATGGASTKAASASTTTMNWTRTGNGYMALVAVPINPIAPMHTVTFDANLGTGTMSPQSASGPTALTLNSFTRTGYSFSGWNTASGGGGTAYANGATYSFAADVTLYAQWTANTYTVTFDANGGSTPSPTSKVVTYDSTYGALATTSRTGYTLAGWFTAASGGTQVTASTLVSNPSNHTLYAQWTANTYTVTFDANGGSTPSPTSKVVTYDSTYGTLASTSRTGYTLAGWFTAASGGTQVTASTIVSNASNHTLYAQWSIIPADTVSLDGPVVTGTTFTGTSVNLNVTTGSGQNRLMLVGVSYNSSSTGSAGSRPYITSVTFTPTSGSPITLDLVLDQWAPPGGTQDPGRKAAIYVMNPANNPAAGIAGTLTVTFSASFTTGAVVGVANFQGVNQTTPLGTPNSAATTNTVATVSVDITTTGTELVFDTVFGGGQSAPTISPNGSQTGLWNVSTTGTSGATTGGASTKTASAGTTTMNWTRTANGYLAIVAVPINPAGGGTTYQLNVAANPTGGGTTNPTVGAHNYTENTVVNITASPNAGYIFANWSGACTGTDPSVCQVTMNSAKSVTANFTALTYTLTANVTGSGSITKNPDQANYAYGASVQVTAVPASGWMFDSWSGALTGTTNPQNITMDGNKTVTATFTQMQADRVYLDGAVSSGTVNNATSISFAHTTGSGDNRFMLVGVSWNAGTAEKTISSVVFSYGAGPTQITLNEVITETVTVSGGSANGPRYAAIYRSPSEPPSGQAGTVTITFSASVTNGVVAGAINFKNVNQTTPLGTAVGAHATAAASSPSLILTDLAGNELVFDTVFLGAQNDTYNLSPDAGQTQQWNGFIGNTRGVASTEQAASPVTMSWTPTTQNWWAQVAVPIRPVGGVIPSHTVTFNANGGSGTMDPQTANTSTALTLNTFTRTGYNFTGWNTAANGSGTAYADGATYSFAADITLYAQWTAVSHTVTFNANGGTGTMDPQTANAPTALTLNTFTRTGYNFTGWNTASGGGGTAYADGATYNFTADITLYAQWTAVSHTVTFNANGGTGSMSPQTANTSTALTLNTFTRSGYNFTGWNSAANGSGTAYADAATYSFAADITLYAQWSQVGTPHTITFDANGGSGTMTAQTASAPAAIKANTFTRSGYNFTGWNSAANGSGTTYADGATYSFAADITLYAQWSAQTTCYLLTLNSGANGSVPITAPTQSAGCDSGFYTAGELINLTAQPNPGYGVKSWSGTDNDSLKTLTNQLTMPAAQRTVGVLYELIPVNQAPVLNPIGNKFLNFGQSLIFIASAMDDGKPNGTLVFSLENGLSGSVPSGANITAGNGVFSWTPSAAGDYTFDVCVSDGALKDCETITVSVIPLIPATNYLFLPLIMK